MSRLELRSFAGMLGNLGEISGIVNLLPDDYLRIKLRKKNDTFFKHEELVSDLCDRMFACDFKQRFC